LISIGWRLFGAWLAWRALNMAVLTHVVHPAISSAAVVSYGVALACLAAGVLCWSSAWRLARRIVGTRRSGDSAAGERGAAMVAVALAGLLCIAIGAVQDVADFVAMAAMMVASGNAEQLTRLAVSITGLVGLGKAAFGALLVFQARGIAARIVPPSAAVAG